ncbi:hypothetical protein BZK31_04355 [Pseudomonas floridensis]|uniref:Uncharacterized protein n=1 Tax=Pseudomonas floridensis TaxID=1958950 RepID=A0A1X0NC71_9PSED|nr:hypothetical protein BZK31_04355 [Pseudomonas floridensis]
MAERLTLSQADGAASGQGFLKVSVAANSQASGVWRWVVTGVSADLQGGAGTKTRHRSVMPLHGHDRTDLTQACGG